MAHTTLLLAWNANGWANIYTEPYAQQLFEAFDIIFISEIWATPTTIETLCPTSFNLLTSNYSSSPGHTHYGTALYYRKNINIEILTHQRTSWKPITWLKIQDYICCFAYLPPINSNYLTHWIQEPIDLLFTQAEHYYQLHPTAHITIMGDLNARWHIPPDNSWNTRGRLLYNITEKEWIIHATGPTHYSRGTLQTFCIDYIIQSPGAANATIHKETMRSQIYQTTPLL